ncbi:MAG: YciK family oxidoreductase [Aeromonadaceae bacterium]|nr:YciK family oxidoreductase [Aeromonadaceae bacterium]
MLDYQAPPTLLAGKIILITGATAGIGRTAALTYAAHGAQLVLLGRDPARLNSLGDELRALGAPQPRYVLLDLAVADQASTRDAIAALALPRLDGLLLNAGVLGSLGPLAEIDERQWHTVLQVNVSANLWLIQACLPLLQQAPQASLLLTSSGVGKRGRAGWGSYAIAKFATEGMMQVLADELAGTGVRVNAINPGATRTAMRAAACPNEDPLTLRTPSDLMPLYLYLMGQHSQGLNGQSWDAQPK